MDARIKVLFASAFLLVLLNGVAAILFASLGFAFVGLVKLALILTGTFALAATAVMLSSRWRRAEAA